MNNKVIDLISVQVPVECKCADKKKAEGFLGKTTGKVKEVASDAKNKAEDVVKDFKDKLDKK